MGIHDTFLYVVLLVEHLLIGLFQCCSLGSVSVGLLVVKVISLVEFGKLSGYTLELKVYVRRSKVFIRHCFTTYQKPVQYSQIIILK